MIVCGSNHIRDIDDEVDAQVRDRLVISYSDDVRSEDIICKIYYEHLNEFKKIPTFQAIADRVMEYNFNVFENAAIMKYEYINGRDFSPNAGNEIHDIAANMEEVYNLTDNANLDYFIEYILKKNKLACIIEAEDKVFIEEGMVKIRHIRDVRIVAHDCQNVLFPDFIDNGLAGYGDFTIYYGISNDDDTLLIGGGW